MNKDPWYSTSICSKLHESRFEDFIAQSRTDRYNLMCYLVDNDILQLYYKDDESSIGDRSISDDATTKSLEALGANISFIDIWIKCFLDIFNARCNAYINAMKYMFKKIPQTIKKIVYS